MEFLCYTNDVNFLALISNNFTCGICFVEFLCYTNNVNFVMQIS